MSTTPPIGALRVWHIPQVPGKAFHVPVSSTEEARKVLDVLAKYDIFQFENRIKPDYCNAAGLEVFVTDNGEGVPGWAEWESDDGENIAEIGPAAMAS